MLKKTTSCCIGLSIALLSVTSAEENVLTVTNGDFSDLTDLQQMADGWYAGIPAGWVATVSSEGTNNYAIRNQAGNFVVNVSALSQTQPAFAAFEQEVGQLSAPGEVTVTFEIREPWHDPDFSMGAVFPSGQGELGGHVYVVEFAQTPAPAAVARFAAVIDEACVQAGYRWTVEFQPESGSALLVLVPGGD
jgi:hypothetical protein